jgi:hypothetical protein
LPPHARKIGAAADFFLDGALAFRSQPIFDDSSSRKSAFTDVLKAAARLLAAPAVNR